MRPRTLTGAQDTTLASGMWKFTNAISEFDLIILAEKLRREEHNYLVLYIRQCGKNQNAICFQYRHGGETNAYQTFLNRTTKMFRKEFGRKFAGYDIASSTIPIK